MTISFYIVKGKARKKDGRLPVYVSVSAHFGRMRRPTSVYVMPDNWDADKHQVKKKEPFHAQLNNRLDAIATNVRTLFSNHPSASIEAVDLEILKVAKEVEANKTLESAKAHTDISFTQLVAYMNEEQQYEVSKNTIIARNHLLSLISKFDSDILVSKINEKWLLAFRNWLAQKGLMNNTINIYISRVNAVLRFAERNNYIEKAPAKINTLKNKESVVIYLTAEELLRFEETEAKKNYHLLDSKQVAKDYFLFMCYTGVRFSDFFLLTTANVKKGNERYEFVLDYVAKKNNVHVICPLTEKALKIIEQYKNDTNFLFPRLLRQNYSIISNNTLKMLGLMRWWLILIIGATS